MQPVTISKAKHLAPLAALLLAACASSPTAPGLSVVPDAVASRAADGALEMVGKPYSYSGTTPAGFDCSGLVQYSYRKVGVKLPRATQAQRREGLLVSNNGLRRGDLLFFDQEGKKSSHVGIYIGDGRFVHAPSSGGAVRVDDLDAAYWHKHFVQARRL
jgi:cell wall-associated NlpC family hydrolase